MDTLIFDAELFIRYDLILKISQNLMAKKGTKPEDISRIVVPSPGTCPVQEIYKKPGVKNTAEAASTAEAARIVSESPEPIAAIAPGRAAEVYGLEILGRDIQDDGTNATRFVVISREATELTPGVRRASPLPLMTTTPLEGFTRCLTYSTFTR